MRKKDLVDVYETTRRTARTTSTWRLQRRVRRVRRALERDRGNEAHQVRLVALETELIDRGVMENRTIPVH